MVAVPRSKTFSILFGLRLGIGLGSSCVSAIMTSHLGEENGNRLLFDMTSIFTNSIDRLTNGKIASPRGKGRNLSKIYLADQ